MTTNQTKKTSALGGNAIATTTKRTRARTAARTTSAPAEAPKREAEKPKKRKPSATKMTIESSAAQAQPQLATRRGAAPEQIATQAYYLFLERGGQHGFDQQDWLEAERRLTGTLG